MTESNTNLLCAKRNKYLNGKPNFQRLFVPYALHNCESGKCNIVLRWRRSTAQERYVEHGFPTIKSILCGFGVETNAMLLPR